MSREWLPLVALRPSRLGESSERIRGTMLR